MEYIWTTFRRISDISDLFCEGMDQDWNNFVLEYFRNSDMEAGTGSYIFIDETGKWNKLIGTKCNYAISYLDNAMFNFDKCGSKN